MAKVSSLVETNVNYLHQISTVVNLKDTDVINEIKEALIGTFNKYGGRVQGLAAVQVRVPKRAILVRYVRGEEPLICFNPEVKVKIGLKLSQEGCESEPGKQYLVKRPWMVLVTYYNENGKKLIKLLPYKRARIFCHEVDHLDGILLQDKGVKVQK